MSDPSSGNPYRAPTSPPPVAPRATEGDEIKWVYLVVVLALSFAPMAGLPKAQTAAVVTLGTLLRVALSIWWLELTWSRIPAFDKAGDNEGDLTPGGLVGRFFIPFYGVYWGFAVSTAICRMINRALARMQMPTRANPALALVAMTVELIYLLVSFGHRATSMAGSDWVILRWVEYALWFGFMMHVDVARKIMVLATRVEEAREREGRTAARAVP